MASTFHSASLTADTISYPIPPRVAGWVTHGPRLNDAERSAAMLLVLLVEGARCQQASRV